MEFTYSCILVGNWYQLAIISFPMPPELYRGHGSAVSKSVGNINSHATGFDMTESIRIQAPGFIRPEIENLYPINTPPNLSVGSRLQSKI